jgi:hypothetical protein
MFLQPIAGSTNAAFDYATASGTNQGLRSADGCEPTRCSVRINNIPAMTLGYLRLKSLYRSSPASIRAFNSAGTQVELVGAQAEIDATGRANDVLRRIQVRQVVTSGSVSPAFPEFALQSYRTMCKRLAVTGTSVSTFPLPGFTPAECQIN